MLHRGGNLWYVGVFPGEGGWITVPPLSIVGANGAVGTDCDDCAIDGTTMVGQRCCLLFLLWGGIPFEMIREFCLICLSQFNRFHIAINKYLLSLIFEFIYNQIYQYYSIKVGNKQSRCRLTLWAG